MTAADELDALRRALYRRDADDEDRLRYETLRARTEAERAAAPTPRPATSRTRRVAILGGGLAIAAAALGLAQAPRARPAPSDPRPSPVTVSVAGAPRTALRWSGTGDAVVPLRGLRAPIAGGRLVVELASSSGAALGWRATRTEPLDGGGTTLRTLATSPRSPRSRFGTPETSVYRGAPPARIEVQADGRRRWTLTVLLLAQAAAPTR